MKTAKRKKGGGRTTYHHGMLRNALVRATDEILTTRGVEGFTLREAARRAQVSPAAPAHHFGSAAGLLTEVAIAGFEELSRLLSEARNAELLPAAQLRAMGSAYVHFALKCPGRFQLMFRHELTIPHNERLETASKAAMAELEASVAAYVAGNQATSSRAVLLGAWSVVHGFAQLALDGKFGSMAQARSLPKFVADELPAVLGALWPDR